MKYFISYCFCFVFFVSLLGCDSSQQKFDRLKAFESTDVIFAPYSRYMQTQTIITKKDGEYESSRIYKYTQEGDILFSKTERVGVNIFNSSFQFDYANDSFNLYSYFYQVNITNGEIIRDQKNKIIGFRGDNDKTIFNNNLHFSSFSKYEDGKPIESVSEAGQLKNVTKIFWDNNLPVKIESLIFKGDKLVVISVNHYIYDEQVRLKKMLLNTSIPSKGEVNSESEIIFSEYNKYGDWTKACTIRKTQKTTDSVITTREIEYW